VQSPISDCRVFIHSSFGKLDIQPAIGREGAPVNRWIMIASIVGGGLHQIDAGKHRYLPHSAASRQTTLDLKSPFFLKKQENHKNIFRPLGLFNFSISCEKSTTIG